jgi:uncharacterized membrane protein
MGERKINNEIDRKPIFSLILGSCALVAWIYPLFGFTISITGLVLGIKGIKTKSENKAIVGLILSIIGLVLTILNSALGAYLGFIGEF